MSTMKAYRGEILHFLADPTTTEATLGSIENSYEFFQDGVLLVENGLVKAVGESKDILPTLDSSITVEHYPNSLIAPGFIDTHIHYPQTEMIGAYGEQLLEWLEQYTFPTERQFHNSEYASEQASFFIKQLLQNGTTTALVFGTVHPESVDAFFHEAEKKNLRMICGKVLMDRNAPDDLLDTAEQGYEESKALIKKWHGRGRLQYAVTPRFAPTSTEKQLKRAGDLLKEYPNLYMHTHLSENIKECEWVQELFPNANNYLDAYSQADLLTRRSVFAHGIHLCDDEYECLAQHESAISFCPTSNLFLGSGLFNLKKAEKHNVNVGLGTDVGAGTSFSLLQTMNEAYKTQQLRGDKLSPFKSFYLATLGGADALDLADTIGNFETGKEADFIVLNYQATDLLSLRMSKCESVEEKLFALSILGDDRTVKATYSFGECVYRN